MTFLIAHSLRARVGSSGGYHAAGWAPRLSATLGGPLPGGAELVWRVTRPDGSFWFEQRMPVPELDEGAFTRLDLGHDGGGGDCEEPGTASFTLRALSELDGVDDLLLAGSLEVVSVGAVSVESASVGAVFVDAAQPGERRFAVQNDRMFELAFLSLDTVDEPDAPRLTVTVFLGGDVEAYQLEAHCFRDGKRFAQASLVSSPYSFTASDGTVVGREFVVAFDDTRGWNALAGSGWGAGWHLLDAADGAYEVKVVRGSTVTRVVPFEVRGGRISLPDAATEVDSDFGAVLLAQASVRGDLDGPRTAHERHGGVATAAGVAFYGADPAGGRWCGVDALYGLQPNHNREPAGAGGVVRDDEPEAALKAFSDRVERLVNTWEEDFLSSEPPFDYSQVLAAEAVLAERPGASVLRDAARAVPGGHPVEFDGVPATVGDLRARLQALFDAAEARISSATEHEADALAPFRALLAGEKLTVFDDHPADAFVYTTSGRRVIETPEQVADAEWWYFEGPLEQPGTATVDGAAVKVSVQGWRVVGWRFDDEGRIVDRVETQGQGASAPLSAYP